MEVKRYRYVVVGGGVAGTCCAIELCRLEPEATVCLVSPSKELKTVKVVQRISRRLDELTVIEQPVGNFEGRNLEVVQKYVSRLDTQEKRILLSDGRGIEYDKLCICTGAIPKVHTLSSKHVMPVRDTDSAQRLSEGLKTAKKVIVAGDGAISLEVVNKVRGVHVVWIVKHGHIGDSFFDVDVARFLLQRFKNRNPASAVNVVESDLGGRDEQAFCEDTSASFDVEKQEQFLGHAIGPQWTNELLIGEGDFAGAKTTVEILYHSNLVDVLECGQGTAGDDWPVHAELSNGQKIGADLVISCIGVLPNTGWISAGAEFEKASDGGLIVDATMRTNVPDVYAAGDVCTIREGDMGPHFFQLRLWAQARMTAHLAAHCMTDSPEASYLTLGFDLFAHVTHFFGKKVILLGLYDGQRLGNEPSEDIVTYSRVTGDTFVRVLLLRGRLRGAVLVGDTELEEVLENLIMSGIDLSPYGPDILDPEVDLADYFD
mmetsp:Transcript_7925/g.20306  ORF Transcript_7925/g.20306 Transcript_7925/m.20306 type:complete len:487 (-) Transcript_7925:79-1539(-)